MQNKLTPILCIGETLEQYQKNITMDVLKKQLTLIFNQLSSTENHNFVIAYEPIWAIGTGLSATPEQAQTIHSQIRDLLKKINIKLAGQVRIIYGGSLKSNNAIGLLSQPDIDGGLIGGASLVSEDFIKIGKIAEQECKH